MEVRADGILDPDGRYPNPFTGLPYSEYYIKEAGDPNETIRKGWRHYNTYKDRIEILKKLFKYQIILVIAGTGVGKTVILPKLVAHYFRYEKPVLITTPRQTTTESAAIYCAQLMDVPIYQIDNKGEYILDAQGNKQQTGYLYVGYKHGDEKGMVNPRQSKIIFSTDGGVKQTIISSDPDLSKYGGVIIDEAHERSVNIDILIAMLVDIAKRRPDFRIIIMSATVNKDTFINYFSRLGLGDKFTTYEPATVEGQYPIEFVKEIKKPQTANMVDLAFQKIDSILRNPQTATGDILCFMTSESETTKVKKLINNKLSTYPPYGIPYVVAMYRGMSKLDNDIALKKNALNIFVGPGYHRKVIISTNMAESSLTFGDPLSYVIDSGLAFEKIYDGENYCYVTGKNYVSQANIIQRCGRTGRTGAGKCIQMYTTDQYNNLKKYPLPNICKEDLTKDLLGIMNLPTIKTTKDARQFVDNMIEPIANYWKILDRAYNNLYNLDMISGETKSLTGLGQVAIQFNKYDIRIVRFLIAGYYMDILPECLALGAILTSVQAFEDMFVLKLYGREDMTTEQQEEELLNRMMRFAHPYGDHITLLIIYLEWLQAPNRKKFCNDNGLFNYKLESISRTYDDLQDTFSRAFNDIVELDLFDLKTPILSGGGGMSLDPNRVLSLVGGRKKRAPKAKSKAETKKAGVEKKSKSKSKLSQAKLIELVKHKTLDLLTLEKYKNKTLNTTGNIILDLLGCLFYGYHINMGSLGADNKYNIKFSPLRPTLKKTTLDKQNKTPDFIIYQEFILAKEYSKEMPKLNIVSEIPYQSMGIFIDYLKLIELAKKSVQHLKK